MFFTKIKRVLRWGFVSFWRNGFVSLSAILIMTITLLVIGSTIFLKAGLASSLEALKARVDINVYFAIPTAESDILAMKTQLEALPEVAKVDYISRDQALADFKAKHESDQLTLQALTVLGDNPLEATLAIRAKDTSQYDTIARFLQQKSGLSTDSPSIIDSINYFQNKDAIDRLTHIIDTADKLGLLISILFIAISVLITFNTIRLVIFISRSEISVMKLVGASNMYIRGPFVVGGMMYGAFSAILTLLILWPLTQWLGPKTAVFFIDLNVYSYFLGHFFELLGILLGSGLVIGAVSSYLAVRKYLKV